MHLWTYIGPTSELTFIIITALINRLDIYIIGMITVVNLYALILYLVQIRIDSRTKLAEIG